MIVIPDYLIIDEIRRREEQSHHPPTLEIPLPSYDVPEKPPEAERDKPEHRKRPSSGIRRKNGAIIIDMNSNRRIL